MDEDILNFINNQINANEDIRYTFILINHESENIIYCLHDYKLLQLLHKRKLSFINVENYVIKKVLHL